MDMSMGISDLIGNLAGGVMLNSIGGVSFMLIVGIAISIMGLLMLIWFDNSRAATTVGPASR